MLVTIYAITVILVICIIKKFGSNDFLTYVQQITSPMYAFLIVLIALLKLLLRGNGEYHVVAIFADIVFLPIFIGISNFLVRKNINKFVSKNIDLKKANLFFSTTHIPFIILLSVHASIHYIFMDGNYTVPLVFFGALHGLITSYFIFINFIIYIVVSLLFLINNEKYSEDNKYLCNIIFYNPVYIFLAIFPIMWGSMAAGYENYMLIYVVFSIFICLASLFIIFLKKVNLKYGILPFVTFIFNFFFFLMVDDGNVLATERELILSFTWVLIFIIFILGINVAEADS